MQRTHALFPSLAATLTFLTASFALTSSASAQQLPDRESMWRAPTAEEWAKPCDIEWQRTWDDAVAVSQATGKPILVCTNMDGEIASEHYAGVRYRDPEIAALYEPYVCVIASVYRHTPRDHDAAGHRIECPRFGTVTCGEHIILEPIVFEKFFDDVRVAPRHVAIELDGTEIYDVYYAFDTQSVFAAIERGVQGRPATKPWPTSDRPLLERVASPLAADREAIEQAYGTGDRELRRQLLVAAGEAGGAAPTEMLRLALFGLDEELARLGARALAGTESLDAVELISKALGGPLPETEREALIVALERLAAQSPRAKLLAAVHRGLSEGSNALDAAAWRAAQPAEYRPAELPPLVSRSATLASRAKRLAEQPEDPEALLKMAEASLDLALDPRSAERAGRVDARAADHSKLLLEDALRQAREAERLGASGWRLDSAISLAAYYLEDRATAVLRAQSAIAALPAGEPSWNTFAVLAIFASERRSEVLSALRAKQPISQAQIADVHAAFEAASAHPYGTSEQVAAHYDFLWWVGADPLARQVLESGLDRFPGEHALHDRLRAVLLREAGPLPMLEHYTGWAAELSAPRHAAWQLGHSARRAAESLRRTGEREDAELAYQQGELSLAGYVTAEPEFTPNANHERALIAAGLARLDLEAGRLSEAAEHVETSFALRPESASTLDGLGLSPVMTATTLEARLRREEATELADRVRAALDGLSADLRGLPAFEAPARPRRPGQGRRRGR